MDGYREEKSNDGFSYGEAVDKIAEKYGVPKSVYQRMIGQESGDNDNAVSPVGAFSAWQIMPGTARGLGYKPEELKAEPLKAAEGGLRILRDNYKSFRKYAENEKHAWMMAVAGYHTNPKNVLKDVKRGGKGLPMTSDGLITTRDHVLKIFDGIEGTTLDRSPMGNVNASSSPVSAPNSSAPNRQFAVNPDLLPKVSINPLPKQGLKTDAPEAVETMPQPAPVQPAIENQVIPEAVQPDTNNLLPKVSINPLPKQGLKNEVLPISEPAPQIVAPVQSVPVTPEPAQVPATDNLTALRVQMETDLQNAPADQRQQIIDAIGKLDVSIKEQQNRVATPQQNSTNGGVLPSEPLQPTFDAKEQYAAYLKDNGKADTPEIQAEFAELLQLAQTGADAENKRVEAATVNNQRISEPIQNATQTRTAQAGISQQQNAPMIAPDAYRLLDNKSGKNEIVKNDTDILNSQAGRVAVDLRKKPADMDANEFALRAAFQGIGGLTNEQIETAVKHYKSKDAEIFKGIDFNKYNEEVDVTLSRRDINIALGKLDDEIAEPVRSDYQNQQTNADMALSMREAVKTGDNDQKEIDRNLAKSLNKTSAALDKFNKNSRDYHLAEKAEFYLRNQQKNDPLAEGREITQDEILETAKLFKVAEADAKELEKIPVIGTLAARAMGGAGRVNHTVAGVARIVGLPFESIIGNAPYKLFKNIGDKSVLLGQMTNPEGSILYEVAGLPFDFARLVALSRLPGGAVTGFALDSGLQTAGRGGNLGQTVKETIKGGSLGALFNLSGGVASQVESNLLKPIARIGTVTGGTYGVEKAFGATDSEALQSAITNGIFEAGQLYGSSLKGKVFRAWEKGKAYTGKVRADGDLTIYESKSDSAPVDFEIVLDAKNPKYSENKVSPEAVKTETPIENKTSAPEAIKTEVPKAEQTQPDAPATAETSALGELPITEKLYSKKSAIPELPKIQQLYIKKKVKDAETAEAVASEVLHSQPKKKLTIGDVVVDLWNVGKAIKASVDISAAGRQGLITAAAHPVIAAKSFVKQIGALGSARYHQKFVRQLENHPFLEAAKKADLYISSLTDGSINAREEQFMSKLLGEDAVFHSRRLEHARKLISYPVRASERAYSTFLDDLRINTFAKLTKEVDGYNSRNNITDAAEMKSQMDGVAKFVNYATGRGSLGKYEDAGAFLNLGIFSARYWASRYQVMNPVFYKNLPPGARKAVVTDFATYVGAFTTALTVAKLSGFEIETDYNNPDFLKVKHGQYRYDLSGGMVNELRFILQTAANVGKGDFTQAAKTILKKGESKLAPSASAVINTARGENFIGEPTTAKDEFKELFTPISPAQLFEGFKKDGSIGLLKSAPDMLGISTARYDNSLEIGMRSAELQRQLVAMDAKTPEAKELRRQIELLGKLEWRAKQQKGELPKDFEFSPEQSDAYAKKGGKPKTLIDMVEFYDKNKDTFFSFAKDEMEFQIYNYADYMQKKGRLKQSDVEAIKKIIPEYEPVGEFKEGKIMEKQKLKKLKKLPKRSKDYPSAPGGKRQKTEKASEDENY